MDSGTPVVSDTAYIIGAALVSLPGTLAVVLSYMNGRAIAQVHQAVNSGLTRQMEGAEAQGQLKGAADERARMAEKE
jgi:hypothetical protein